MCGKKRVGLRSSGEKKRGLILLPSSLITRFKGWPGWSPNYACSTRVSCCLICSITSSRPRESPDCPSVRASDEHSFTVRVLRARRAPGRSLPTLRRPRVAEHRRSSGSIPFPLFGVIMVDHVFRVIFTREQGCSPKEAQASDYVRRRPASRTVAVA